MLGEKKADEKEHILYDLIYIKFRKFEVVYSDRNQISGCLGMAWGGGDMQIDYKKS